MRNKTSEKGISLVAAVLCMVSFFITMPDVQVQSQAAEWTALGTLPAGAWKVAPDPANPNALYALTGAGIVRSTDRGATWSPCAGDATMMQVSNPTGNTGAALLYESGPAGLRVTADGCATWKTIAGGGNAPTPADVRWIAPYPNNGSILYAGMNGLGGLYRSTDSGASWSPASVGLPSGAWVTALAADPTQPSIVFIGVQYASDNHPPSFIYRSPDGGVTWRSASLGLKVLPNNGAVVVGLAWSAGVLFAGMNHDGLFRSTDRGLTWAEATMPRQDSPGKSSPAMPLSITSFGGTPDGALAMGTAIGGFQSLDGGRTWQALGPTAAQGKAVTIALDGTSRRIILEANSKLWGGPLPNSNNIPAQATAITNQHNTATPPPPPQIATNTPPNTPTRTATATNTVKPTASPTPTVAFVTGSKPTDPVQPLGVPASDFFPETGHNIRNAFRDYWLANGGLARFGYPLTDEFTENNVIVQYFERSRFEFRDGTVTLGLLGSELSQGFNGSAFRPIPFFISTDTNVYFGPTKHSVSGPFLDFWRANGRVDDCGYPISESYQPDQNTEVQWFERCRFEWHRELPASRRIVLAQLGRETLQARGWLK